MELIMQFPPVFTPSLLGQNMFLITLFWYTYVPNSSVMSGDVASHPYKITGKITIVFYQLDSQILCFNIHVIFLYMFWSLLCSSSGGQVLLLQHLVSSLSSGDCSDHRLWQDSRNLRSEQSPEESDDTRCCNNTIVLLKMSTTLFETCRGV